MKNSFERCMKTLVLRGLTCSLTLLLAACGGGGPATSPDADNPSIRQFTSDAKSYFVGERAQLTAVYANGTGRIQPGDIAVSSGQTITTPPLTANTTFRLIIAGRSTAATREIAVTVSYRERMRAIPMPFARTEHAAVTLSDGRLLIVGGRDQSQLVARQMYLFDPTSETFAPFGSLGTAGPLGSVAVTLADGNVLIVGGVPASVHSNAVSVDVRTGAVVRVRTQPHSHRVWATGTRLPNGKVLIVGGLLATTSNGNAIGVSTTLDRTAEAYDPATGGFTLLPVSLSEARHRHTAVATNDGRVLIYGGLTGSGQPAPPELYDPATNTFAVLAAPENNVRANHAAVRTLDGSIWIVGGDDNNSASALTSVIRFDPTSSALSDVLDLATPRRLLGAAPLADSRMLISGGATDLMLSQVTESSELIVTKTSLRSDGPQMISARSFHTMTLLTNGKVLIVGGSDQSGIPLASAELHE
jgi:hypothetical protein